MTKILADHHSTQCESSRHNKRLMSFLENTVVSEDQSLAFSASRSGQSRLGGRKQPQGHSVRRDWITVPVNIIENGGR